MFYFTCDRCFTRYERRRQRQQLTRDAASVERLDMMPRVAHTAPRLTAVVQPVAGHPGADPRSDRRVAVGVRPTVPRPELTAAVRIAGRRRPVQAGGVAVVDGRRIVPPRRRAVTG